jgi:hypothetical protein
MKLDPASRALLAVAVAARDTADLARGIVVDLDATVSTRERIRAWRKVRLQALTGLDRCVLHELLRGATWEEVADGYGLSAEDMRTKFEPTLEVWRRENPPRMCSDLTGEFTVGLPHDGDPEGTATSLDTWVNRHAEPWQEVGVAPVSAALRGE